MGEINLEEQLSEDILELLIASDELFLEELVEYLQEYLVANYCTNELFLPYLYSLYVPSFSNLFNNCHPIS